MATDWDDDLNSEDEGGVASEIDDIMAMMGGLSVEQPAAPQRRAHFMTPELKIFFADVAVCRAILDDLQKYVGSLSQLVAQPPDLLVSNLHV